MANFIAGFIDVDVRNDVSRSDYNDIREWSNRRGSKLPLVHLADFSIIHYRLLLTPEDFTFLKLTWPNAIVATEHNVDSELDIPSWVLGEFTTLDSVTT